MAKIEEFAKNISNQIAYMKKSTAQIARDLGVTSGLVYDYTYAKTYPSIKMLMKLCVYFDCSYEDLLGKPE